MDLRALRQPYKASRLNVSKLRETSLEAKPEEETDSLLGKLRRGGYIKPKTQRLGTPQMSQRQGPRLDTSPEAPPNAILEAFSVAGRRFKRSLVTTDDVKTEIFEPYVKRIGQHWASVGTTIAKRTNRFRLAQMNRSANAFLTEGLADFIEFGPLLSTEDPTLQKIVDNLRTEVLDDKVAIALLEKKAKSEPNVLGLLPLDDDIPDLTPGPATTPPELAGDLFFTWTKFLAVNKGLGAVFGKAQATATKSLAKSKQTTQTLDLVSVFGKNVKTRDIAKIAKIISQNSENYYRVQATVLNATRTMSLFAGVESLNKEATPESILNSASDGFMLSLGMDTVIGPVLASLGSKVKKLKDAVSATFSRQAGAPAAYSGPTGLTLRSRMQVLDLQRVDSLKREVMKSAQQLQQSIVATGQGPAVVRPLGPSRAARGLPSATTSGASLGPVAMKPPIVTPPPVFTETPHPMKFKEPGSVKTYVKELQNFTANIEQQSVRDTQRALVQIDQLELAGLEWDSLIEHKSVSKASDENISEWNKFFQNDDTRYKIIAKLEEKRPPIVVSHRAGLRPVYMKASTLVKGSNKLVQKTPSKNNKLNEALDFVLQEWPKLGANFEGFKFQVLPRKPMDIGRNFDILTQKKELRAFVWDDEKKDLTSLFIKSLTHELIHTFQGRTLVGLKSLSWRKDFTEYMAHKISRLAMYRYLGLDNRVLRMNRPIQQRRALITRPLGSLVEEFFNSPSVENFEALVPEVRLSEQLHIGSPDGPKRSDLIDYLESESKKRLLERKNFQAKAYSNAAKLLRNFSGALPTSLDQWRRLKGFGPKLADVSFTFMQGAKTTTESSVREIEQQIRVPEVPKPRVEAPENLGAAQEVSKYLRALATESKLGKVVKMTAPKKFYYDVIDTFDSLEQVGAIGAWKSFNQVEIAFKHYGEELRKLDKLFLDSGADVNKLSKAQSQLVVKYFESGTKPEKLDPTYATLVETLKDLDESKMKGIVKRLRIDRFVIDGRTEHLTPKQQKLLKHFTQLYKHDPEKYYRVIEEYVKKPASDTLVVENYFTRKWKDQSKIPSLDVDLRLDKSGLPGRTSTQALRARKGKTLFTPRFENPLLDMYHHYRSLFKTYYLSRPLNAAWEVAKPWLGSHGQFVLKNQLKAIVGMSTVASPLERELSQVAGNLFKVVAFKRVLPLKNLFQRFLSQTPAKGLSVREALSINTEKAFRKKWESVYPGIYERVRIEVEQDRYMPKEMFAKGLDIEPLRELGVSAGAARLLGNNVVIRQMNKLLADHLANLHILFDKSNRISSMDKWLTLGKRALIEQKLPWTQAKMFLGQPLQSKSEHAYIAELVSEGKLSEAVYENARLNTRHTQYEYAKVLRNYWSNTTGGRFWMQYSTWYRNYSLLWARAADYAAKSENKVGAARYIAKLLGYSVVLGTVFEVIVGRLRPGDGFVKRLWNTAIQTLNPLSFSGIGGPNTLTAPVSMIAKLASEEAPSQILAESLSVLRGALTAGKVLALLATTGKLSKKDKEKLTNESKNLLNIGDRYLNAFYAGYRQVSRSLSTESGTRRLNLLRQAAKDIWGLEYSPDLQDRSLWQRVSGHLFMTNPPVSERDLNSLLRKLSENDVGDIDSKRYTKELASYGETLESAITRLKSYGAETTETKKRRWTVRETSRRVNRLRRAWRKNEQSSKLEVEALE